MARRKTTSNLVPPTNVADGGKQVKHKQVFDYLYGSIQSGALKPGDRLPSEAELGEMFNASRITVAKAVLELQRLGLVTRRPGAGTHVLAQKQASGHTFGLLIPELGLTEIFEPICHGMMRTPFVRPDSLLWGSASGSVRESAKEAEQMAQSYISQNVSGVFFAPLELTSERDTANQRIVRMLERARIPVVLLDRGYLPYPEQAHHDLVGIDNRSAGFIATRHLLQHKKRKLVFVGEANTASTVDARITGFYEALRMEGILPERELAWRGSPVDEGFVRRMLENGRPEGIVCANDLTAARLMQTLQGMSVSIPENIAIVGIDDVKYASLLSVPLTTVHQDCAGIGALAMATMLERIEHPELPVREINAPIWLVERRSCGAEKN